MDKLKIPTSELNFSFSRSSGAGGQNVNKVNTKVTLRWCVYDNTSLPKDIVKRFIAKYSKKITSEGILTIVSQKSRSQNLNTTEAINKLYAMINSVAIAPKIRKKTKPTASSIAKRLSNKKSHSEKKKRRQEKY